MWWGYSEALDLIDEIPNEGKGSEEKLENNGIANILLIGQYDNRHVLKTIAQKYRHKENLSINFYIYEPLLENIARELLFTLLALEPSDRLGIAEKTLFFMELYGNTLLRPATKKYLTKASKTLLNVVTNINYGLQILPSVSLDNLKYRERDQLEVIFKYWISNSSGFDVVKAWDERLRKELGIRYDSRNGVFDWDYHMRYHCSGADVLKLQEYKRFRERGISFYFEDTDPCIANPTLASAIFSSGSRITSYGYLGDIKTGPYPCYGFKCEDEDMLKKINGQMPKTSTDVTERNLTRMFHEIHHQTPFRPNPGEDAECLPVVMQDTSSKLKIMSDELPEENQIRIKDACEVYESLTTHDCRLIYLPTSGLNDFSNKSRYQNLFDLVFVSQAMALRHLKPETFKMFRPTGRILVETPKYLLNYRKENLEEFKKNLIELMELGECKLKGSYNHEMDEFVRFTVNK